MSKLVSILKNKIIEKNADNFLNEDELSLNKYFQYVKKISKIIELIKLNKRKIKDNEISKILN